LKTARRAIAAVLGAASVLATPAVVWAQPSATQVHAPSRVRVVLPACETDTTASGSLIAMLRIELRANGVEEVDWGAPDPSAAGDPSLAVVTIDAPCSGSTGAWNATVAGAATGRSVARRLDFASLEPAARGRALALAVAEILRASWDDLSPREPAPAEDRAQPAPAPDPAPPRPPPVTSEAAPGMFEGSREAGAAPAAPEDPRPSPWRATTFGVALQERWWSVASTRLLNVRGELGLAAPWKGPWRIILATNGGFGTSDCAIGAVDVTLDSVAAGVALATGSDVLGFELAPELEVGWAHETGSSITPTTYTSQVQGAVVIASLHASGVIVLGEHWRLVGGFEGGYALAALEAQADGQVVAGIGGTTLGGRLGAAFAF
jgi:hypothetical protein